MKKLIPYGAKLDKLLSSGFKPKNDVYCFCGLNAWQKAKAFHESHFAICIPLNENPFKFRWPVVGCSVLLFDTSGLQVTEIEKIVYSLLDAGASIVHVVDFDLNLFVFSRGTE